jgi:hypothetical protein
MLSNSSRNKRNAFFAVAKKQVTRAIYLNPITSMCARHTKDRLLKVHPTQPQVSHLSISEYKNIRSLLMEKGTCYRRTSLLLIYYYHPPSQGLNKPLPRFIKHRISI